MRGGFIGTTEVGLANNGMHQFTEVTKDGVSMIYDNMHVKGILKSDFIKGLAGDIEGKLISGKELIKTYTKKIK